MSQVSSPHFEPNPQDLQQALALLEALRDPRRSDHGLALQTLNQNITGSDSFVLHMMFIFAYGKMTISGPIGSTAIMTEIDINLRQLAGFIIKNYVFIHLLQLPPQIQHYLKVELLRVLHDPCLEIRNTGAILLSKFTQSFAIDVWIDLLPPIIQCLDVSFLQSPQQAVSLDGCLQAMKRICEDSAVKLAMDQTIRPIEALLPKLLALFHCSEASIRLRALECYNCLLYLLENADSLPLSASSHEHAYLGGAGAGAAGGSIQANVNHPLILHMNTFIASLSSLASDPEAKVRKVLCSALTTITCLHITVLEPYFQGICEFMSMSTLMDSQEEVAIESCEFWIAMLQHVNQERHGYGGHHHNGTHPTTFRRLVANYLPKIIPNLITRLYLTKEQMENERQEEEEENAGKRKIQIKPMHHRNSQSDDAHAGDDPRGDGGHGSSAEGELSSKWTLRKQAALTLDSFAMSFPPKDILAVALPKIQECFQSQSNDPLLKESGVLALGALSNGCLDEMTMYLPQLFPFLVSNITQDALPEMRSITCWVLSRYCRLFADIYNNGMNHGGDGEDGTQSPTQAGLTAASSSSGSSTSGVLIPPQQGIELYLKTLEVLVGRMFDPHVKVIIAACSALCILIDNSFVIYHEQSGKEENLLIPHVLTIFQVIGQAFDRYGPRPMLLLVDMIGTLADTLGRDVIAQPMITALYLPKLMSQFAHLMASSIDAGEEIDCRVLPFLECFTSLIGQIGMEAKDYLPMVLDRCMQLLSKTLLPLQRQISQGSGTVVTNHQDLLDEEEEALMHLDYAICALDVIAAMSEGLEIPAFVALVGSKVAILIPLLFMAMECSHCPELRQSAFSLAGELCKLSATAKQPQLFVSDDPQFAMALQSGIEHGDEKNALFSSELVTRLFHYATMNLQEDYPFVCNNAAWMIGELVVRFQTQVKLLSPFVTSVSGSTSASSAATPLSSPGGASAGSTSSNVNAMMLERLVYALHSHEIQDNLKINLAVTIGRLGSVCTLEVASMAEDFFCDWCSVLAFPCPVTEKRQAFAGLLAVLRTSQDLILGNKATMYSLLVACVSWSEMAPGDLTPELAQGFGQVFSVLQTYDNALWTKVINTFSHNGFSVQALIALFAQ